MSEVKDDSDEETKAMLNGSGSSPVAVITPPNPAEKVNGFNISINRKPKNHEQPDYQATTVAKRHHQSRPKARHSLFTDFEGQRKMRRPPFMASHPSAAKNATPAETIINFDIEAVKLDHDRRVWKSGSKTSGSNADAISSEESLSDCEELGVSGIVNEDSSHRLEGTSRVLWDEVEIEKVFNDLMNLRFGAAVGQEIMGIIQKENLFKIKSYFELKKDLLGSDEQLKALILHSCWKTDNPNIINYFLDKGADPNSVDKDGRSCLHLGKLMCQYVIAANH